MVNKWSLFTQFKGPLGWLYPPRCLICGADGAQDRDLCTDCHHELPWNLGACPRCALPLPAGAGTSILCARCIVDPPPYDAAWSLFRYGEPVRHLHRRLKFSEKLSHARLLAELLADGLGRHLEERQLPAPGRILVMPLHPGRLRRRGFNQALELIRPVARRLNIALDLHSCRRLRATAPQSDLPASQRKRNVRGAFAYNANLGNQSVVIFDDVVTTGHTVAELARVLKRAGASRVEVWSLARAI